MKYYCQCRFAMIMRDQKTQVAYCSECKKEIDESMSKEESKPDTVSAMVDRLTKLGFVVLCPEDFISNQVLEKELSELRKENEELHQSEILWFERNSDLESQLSKAKELLRTATTWIICRREGKVICDEIESFLKS